MGTTPQGAPRHDDVGTTPLRKVGSGGIVPNGKPLSTDQEPDLGYRDVDGIAVFAPTAEYFRDEKSFFPVPDKPGKTDVVLNSPNRADLIAALKTIEAGRVIVLDLHAINHFPNDYLQILTSVMNQKESAGSPLMVICTENARMKGKLEPFARLLESPESPFRLAIVASLEKGIELAKLRAAPESPQV